MQKQPPKWYQRCQFQIGANFQLFPGQLSLKEWLFSPFGNMTKLGQEITSRNQLPESSSWFVDTLSVEHDDKTKTFYSNVFWVSAAIRVLGLDVGVGFYYRRTDPKLLNTA